MGVEEERQATAWRERSRVNLLATYVVYETSHWYAVTNCAYYAAYQAAPAVCIAHGDQKAFPNGWNNPSHEQLPELIRNNGELSIAARRQVIRALRYLRTAREDADYRIGRTIDKAVAMQCLRLTSSALKLLGVMGTEEADQ